MKSEKFKFPINSLRGHRCVIVLMLFLVVLAGPGISARAAPATFADPGPAVGDRLEETAQKELRAVRVQEGASAWECGAVTGAVVPVQIAAHVGRRGITLRNLDGALLVYIGPDAATAQAMTCPLNPGDSVPLDTTAAVYVYAPTGAPKVSWVATYTPPAAGVAVTVQPPVIR